MGMLIEMVLVMFGWATFWPDAAASVPDVTRRFLRMFELIGESLIGRICHNVRRNKG